MEITLACLNETLEFDETEVVQMEGARAFDNNALDTDNPYPEGSTQREEWSEGWWRATDAWLRQEYPDRF